MWNEQRSPMLMSDVLLTHPSTPTISPHRLCRSITSPYFLICSPHDSYSCQSAFVSVNICRFGALCWNNCCSSSWEDSLIWYHYNYTLPLTPGIRVSHKICSILLQLQFHAKMGTKTPLIRINTTWAVPVLCPPTHKQIHLQPQN